MAPMDPAASARLDEAVDELYGLAPGDFLAARSRLAALAKAAGDGEAAAAIAALRKPTLAAWAVNILARRRPGDLDRLADLAAELREAQQQLDGARMTTLARSRTSLVDELVALLADVVAQAGARLTPAAARDAGATFVAALASPAATAAVVSGRLTRALEYAGFGDVDIRDATARPLRLVPSPVTPAPLSSRGRQPAAPGDPPDEADEADEALEPSPAVIAAEADLHAAMAAATAATTRCGVLAAEAELAETRVASLQKELVRARTHRDTVAEALAAAEIAREDADAALTDVRTTLEQLRRTSSDS